MSDRTRKAPKSVRVGYLDLPLRPMSDYESRQGRNVGTFSIEDGIIYTDGGRAVEEPMNTILHETLHAIWYTQAIGGDKDEEERLVNSLANGLTQVFRDNPELIRWILSKLVKS